MYSLSPPGACFRRGRSITFSYPPPSRCVFPSRPFKELDTWRKAYEKGTSGTLWGLVKACSEATSGDGKGKGKGKGKHGGASPRKGKGKGKEKGKEAAVAAVAVGGEDGSELSMLIMVAATPEGGRVRFGDAVRYCRKRLLAVEEQRIFEAERDAIEPLDDDDPSGFDCPLW